MEITMEDMALREIHITYGISRRAVQGYEKANLVSATGKNDYGHLLYNDSAQARIRQIKLYQDMGFSIKEIKKIIDNSNDVLRTALIEQKNKLQKDISHTNNMIVLIQDMLKHL